MSIMLTTTPTRDPLALAFRESVQASLAVRQARLAKAHPNRLASLVSHELRTHVKVREAREALPTSDPANL